MLRELVGLPRVIYVDPKGGEYAFGIRCDEVEQVKQLTESGRNYSVRVPTKTDYWLQWCCNQALAVSHLGPLTLAVDEMHLFCSPTSMPEALNFVLIDGPWRGVSLICTAHRPVHVHNDLLAAADCMIVFQTTHRRDIDRLQHYTDIDADVFMSLKKDECIVWDIEKPGTFEIQRGSNGVADPADDAPDDGQEGENEMDLSCPERT